MEHGVLSSIALIAENLRRGGVVPYLGPGVLALDAANVELPQTTEALARRLAAKSNVPQKLGKSFSATAQFIENFKHRKTLTAAMSGAFGTCGKPTRLHTLLLQQAALPLVVNAWYDALPQHALQSRTSWGMLQGVSQAEHRGRWFHLFEPHGNRLQEDQRSTCAKWRTLLYQPLGSVWPAENYLVSDSDFVEVLTEIDIQTPIPAEVQQRRTGRSFLFLGCRFDAQLERQFARQIMKRSSQQHWVVFQEQPAKNEQRFLVENGIAHLKLSLQEFTDALQSQFESHVD